MSANWVERARARESRISRCCIASDRCAAETGTDALALASNAAGTRNVAASENHRRVRTTPVSGLMRRLDIISEKTWQMDLHRHEEDVTLIQ